jgi:hypothetical protein
MEFRVWQKAEVWYVASVEATTEQEAIKIASTPNSNVEWELDLETAVMLDEVEVWSNDF